MKKLQKQNEEMAKQVDAKMVVCNLKEVPFRSLTVMRGAQNSTKLDETNFESRTSDMRNKTLLENQLTTSSGTQQSIYKSGSVVGGFLGGQSERLNDEVARMKKTYQSIIKRELQKKQIVIAQSQSKQSSGRGGDQNNLINHYVSILPLPLVIESLPEQHLFENPVFPLLFQRAHRSVPLPPQLSPNPAIQP